MLGDGNDSAGDHLRVRSKKSEQEIRKEKLLHLLAVSKQRVVQHLLQSRSIQRSLQQTEIVELAVKAHLQHIQDNKSTSLARSTRAAESSLPDKVAGEDCEEDDDENNCLKQLWFPEEVRRHIEESVGLEPQCATKVLQSLSEYRDEKLRRELNAFPASEFPDLDSALFVRVAQAASNFRITALEAAGLFSRAQKVFGVWSKETGGHHDPTQNDSQRKWDVLKNVLRKKIRMVFLATAVRDMHNLSFEATSLMSTRTTTSPGKGVNATAKRATGRGPESSHDSRDSKVQSVAHLSAKFHKSVSKQGELSDKIVSRLSEISQTVAIGDHKSAVAFARRMCVRKVESILQKVARRALQETLRRWDFIVKSYKAEENAVTCLRYFGTYQILYALQSCLNNKMARAVRKFKLNVSTQQENEHLAAVLELQRHLRGSLFRIRRWHRLRQTSAIHIQCIVRCKIARRRVRLQRQRRFFMGHVRRIEAAFSNYRLRVVGKQIQKFKLQKNKACMIQRTFRGHKGRVRVAKMRLELRRNRAVTRIQGLLRCFVAIKRVAKLLLRKKQLTGAVKMQSVVRGRFGRIRFAGVKRRYLAARMIQSCVRCSKARKTCRMKRRWKCAIKIQRIGRGLLGRRRFEHFDAIRAAMRLRRKNAIAAMSGPMLGFMIRLLWAPRVRQHVQRRKRGAIFMQKIIRGFLARTRVSKMLVLQAAIARRLAKEKAEAEARLKIQNAAATKVQRLMRGRAGRRKAQARREKFERIKFLESRIPLYYRLREDYYRTQNLHHRPYMLRIQCFVRSRFATRQVMILRRHRASRRIQKTWRSHTSIRKAKNETDKRRQERRRLNLAATDIQRIVRGFMGRFEVKKHEKAEIAKWFMLEIKSLGLLGKALQNFRIRKRTLDRISRQVVKVQALVRRFLVRCKYLRGHKRLVREREARKKARRIKACTRIQGFARIIKAKKLVMRRRKIVDEENRLKATMDELEGKLEGIHGDLMTDLMATRAQTSVRGMLGKKAGTRQEAAVAMTAKQKIAQKKNLAVTKIQALVRGMQSRVRFKRNLATLTKERQMRSFCVECETSVAVKRCRECKDRFCEACFVKLHRKGVRRKHAWDPVSVHEKDIKAKKAGDGATTNAAGGTSQVASNKKDWEKFYDNAAKAHYWFNSRTQEATWVNPL